MQRHIHKCTHTIAHACAHISHAYTHTAHLLCDPALFPAPAVSNALFPFRRTCSARPNSTTSHFQVQN